MAIPRRSSYLLAGLALSPACTFPDYVISGAALGGAGGSGTMSMAGLSGTAPSGGSTGAGAGAADGGMPDAGQSGLAGASGQAGAGPAPGSLAGLYRLVAVHSSKCVDADGPSSTDGQVTFQQVACDSARPQALRLVESGNGYYTLTVDGSSDCMDVQNHATENQTPIVRAACDDGTSQQWLPVKQDDGSYFLINHLTSKCLDVPAKSLNDVSLQQFTCNVGGNQRWAFSSLVPTPLPLIVDDFFVPRAWSSTGESPYQTSASRNVDAACDGFRASEASGDCHSVAIDEFASGTDRAGATWLYPRDSWGNLPGLLVEPSAQRVHFQARGAKGGEKVIVKAGGVAGNGFDDEVTIAPITVTLSTSWQDFSLPLNGMRYGSGIISAFSWRVDASANSVPVKLYIDNIVWE